MATIPSEMVGHSLFLPDPAAAYDLIASSDVERMPTHSIIIDLIDFVYVEVYAFKVTSL